MIIPYWLARASIWSRIGRIGASIASKAGNSNLLMPVLSFPIIIPMLLVLIKASKKAMDGLDIYVIWPDLFVLLAIDIIVIALAYILFPFLWKD